MEETSAELWGEELLHNPAQRRLCSAFPTFPRASHGTLFAPTPGFQGKCEHVLWR